MMYFDLFTAVDGTDNDHLSNIINHLFKAVFTVECLKNRSGKKVFFLVVQPLRGKGRTTKEMEKSSEKRMTTKLEGGG